MKIKNKLLAVFVGLASVAGIVGFLAIKSLSEIKIDMIQINKSSLLELQNSTEMAYEIIELDGLFKQYIHQAIEKNTREVAIAKKKLQECFIGFEKALRTRKSITKSGRQFYELGELQDENEELKRAEYIEKTYSAFKRDILECVAEYEKNGSVVTYELHNDKWKNEINIFIGTVKKFKNESENEIAASTENVVNKAKKSTNSMMVIATISLLLAIIACIYLSKSIVSPILTLNAAAQNIAAGNMDAVASIKTRGEIGDLIISFNKMVVDLKSGRRLIDDYNMSLEQKVNERTKELEENVNKLKQTEQKLKNYANNLKISNLELEQFAYVASHDLQEPLRTVTSYAQMFKKKYFGKLDLSADKYIRYIVEAAERMGVLIKDLLDYSRIGITKDVEGVDCNIILRNVKSDIDQAIKDSAVEIKSESLPLITGHASELKQLFQNLILNSIKFRKKNVIPQISISAKREHDYWQFAFTDNGIGIDPQYKERIFIIFQRLHTRSEYQGSGIGLSHCKKIVELHHGKIWMESKPDGGSTFYFTIQSPKEKIRESKIELQMLNNDVTNPHHTIPLKSSV